MRRIILGSVLLLWAAGGLEDLGSQPGAGAADFPLQKGAWWVFSGTIQLRGPSSAAIARPIQLKAEVVEIFEGGYLKTARVRGCPQALLFSPEPEECVMAVVGSGRVFLVDPPRSGEVLGRLRDARDELVGLFHESEQLLDLPLTFGKRIGETAQLTRQCRQHSPKTPSCGFIWTVTAESRSRGEFELTWRGQTGEKRLRFSPRIGITGFAWEHGPSGTAGDIKLVQYHPGRD